MAQILAAVNLALAVPATTLSISSLSAAVGRWPIHRYTRWQSSTRNRAASRTHKHIHKFGNGRTDQWRTGPPRNREISRWAPAVSWTSGPHDRQAVPFIAHTVCDRRVGKFKLVFGTCYWTFSLYWNEYIYISHDAIFWIRLALELRRYSGNVLRSSQCFKIPTRF